MIWHIFKKDLRLTWPLAAGVTILHWTLPVILIRNNFLVGQALANLIRLLVIGSPLATGFLIAVVVQQDAIPGVRQDWLVRPIRRFDLLMAKLLFAALVVQVPIFVADLALGIFSRATFSSALAAALLQSLIQMLVINLTFVALAAVTRNVLELLTGIVGLALAAAVVDGLTIGTPTLNPVMRTGSAWIAYYAMYMIAIAGTALILRIQYMRRQTGVSRVTVCVVAICCLLTLFFPWKIAFAIQKALSTAPDLSGNLNLDFYPQAGPFRPPAGGFTQEEALAALRASAANFRDFTVQSYIPLRFSGLPPDSAVRTDYSQVRMIRSGVVRPLEVSRWRLQARDPGSSTQMVYPVLAIPAALYNQMKDAPVRIEIDAWLTLASVASSHELPPFNGQETISGVGGCTTKINDSQTAVQVNCLEPATVPPCLNVFLEHTPTHQQNPNQYLCANYDPVILEPIFPIALRPGGVALPFSDPSGLAHYPVDGSKVPESHAVLQVYRIDNHFLRKVVIPEIRLSDWTVSRE